MSTLWDMNVSKQQFANEIERYFFYHSIRKTNIQQTLKDQINHERARREKVNDMDSSE
jgi:hypothetical protein